MLQREEVQRLETLIGKENEEGLSPEEKEELEQLEERAWGDQA